MKFKKPSSASMQDSATLLGGVVAGGAVSKGIIGLIHEDKAGLTADETKKQDQTRMFKRAALVAAAFVGASALDGKDTVTTLVKGALTGVAGVQALEIVKEVSAKNTAVTKAVAGSTKAKVFLAQTLGLKGLGCGCNDVPAMSLNRPHHRRKQLGVYVPEVIPMQRSSSLDAIVKAGRAA